MCRFALLTTGGVHRHTQPAYDIVGPRDDPSYQIILAGTLTGDLTIADDYYENTDAERDLNILFPLELFRELASDGRIGALASCYSFIARTIKTAEIATASVIGLKESAKKVRSSRALYLKWPFGHPLGEPFNRAQQQSVIHCALEVLYTIGEPGRIVGRSRAAR